MNPSIIDTYANSFRARLYLHEEGRNTPLRLSQPNDKFSWGVSPENDWLQTGGNEPSLIISFDYHSMEDNRLHYHLHIPGRSKQGSGPQVPRRLGVSTNGYLGFYWIAEVTDYWKIEPLQETEEGLLCHLRDHLGHRVGTLEDTPHHQPGRFNYLNISESEIATFLLQKTS